MVTFAETQEFKRTRLARDLGSSRKAGTVTST
jgi:hypothetical protein